MKVEEFKSIIISSMKHLCSYSQDYDITLSSLISLSIPLLNFNVQFGNDTIVSSNSRYDQSGLHGFNSIGDFNFLGCSACSDTELPVFFILYYGGDYQHTHDDGIKVYVPTVGNYYCNDHMCAYGNCECEFDYNIEFDWVEIKKEITERYVTKDNAVVSIYSDWTDTKLINLTRKLYNEVFVRRKIIPYNNGIEITNEEKLTNLISELLRRGYSQTVSIDFMKRVKK